MSFAQVAKGYLSTIANKNSFSLITNMRVASVSTDWAGLPSTPVPMEFGVLLAGYRVSLGGCYYKQKAGVLDILIAGLQDTPTDPN